MDVVLDSDGSQPEASYMVERWAKPPGQQLVYVIEVYHEQLVVLPDLLASICAALHLDEHDVGYITPH